MDHLERIRAAAERVARSHGLELFDVHLRRESIGWVLRVTLDRPPAEDGAPPAPDAAGAAHEGVTVQDCQRVSQDLSAILDVEDPIEHAYTLEVSSPGLDRPLRHAGDYRRFAGRLAKLVAKEPVDGQTYFSGRLRGVEDERVVLAAESGRIHRIPLDRIARGRLEVEF